MIRTCRQARAVFWICGPSPAYCQHTWAMSWIRWPGAAMSQSMNATGPKHAGPVPVDGVPGRQVVVAYDLTSAGQPGADGQIMELAEQASGLSQAVIGPSPPLLGFLPQQVPGQEAEDLPAVLVHTPEPRRALPADPFQPLQQQAHEPRIPAGAPANRVTDPDHLGHEPATQRLFTHTTSLPSSGNRKSSKNIRSAAVRMSASGRRPG